MNMNKTRLTFVTIGIAACLFFLLERNFLPGLSKKDSLGDKLKLVGNAAYLIRDEYVEEPNPATTMEGAFRGLVDSLDVESSYLNKDALAKFALRKDANLFEPGLILYKSYGRFPVIIGVKENSPAEQKGIRVGDTLSAIDGKSTLPMSMLEANLALKSRADQPLKLKILHGNETKIIDPGKALLAKEVCLLEASEGSSGILKINRFYPPCTQKIKEELLPNLENQTKPLILDLRDCSEGEIEEAQSFLNIFLHRENIGYFEKKGGLREDFSLGDEPLLGTLPLIIWTNQATIGASEVVAGVLSEFREAKIIGLKTPGLVAKQELIPLEDGSGLLLTSAVFHLSEEKAIWNHANAQIAERKQPPPNFPPHLCFPSPPCSCDNIGIGLHPLEKRRAMLSILCALPKEKGCPGKKRRCGANCNECTGQA
jgi:carboxyl-terminal processing protease